MIYRDLCNDLPSIISCIFFCRSGNMNWKRTTSQTQETLGLVSRNTLIWESSMTPPLVSTEWTSMLCWVDQVTTFNTMCSTVVIKDVDFYKVTASCLVVDIWLAYFLEHFLLKCDIQTAHKFHKWLGLTINW